MPPLAIRPIASSASGIPGMKIPDALIRLPSRHTSSMRPTTTDPSWPAALIFCQASGSGRSRQRRASGPNLRPSPDRVSSGASTPCQGRASSSLTASRSSAGPVVTVGSITTVVIASPWVCSRVAVSCSPVEVCSTASTASTHLQLIVRSGGAEGSPGRDISTPPTENFSSIGTVTPSTSAWAGRTRSSCMVIQVLTWSGWPGSVCGSIPAASVPALIAALVSQAVMALTLPSKLSDVVALVWSRA